MINSELVSLLSIDDKNELHRFIEQDGYYSISDINTMISKNSLSLNDVNTIDVDMIISIDLHTNDKTFMIDNEIYTRDQIISHYKLNEFKIEPEMLFEQQKIEVIGDDYHLYDNNTPKNNTIIYNTKIYIGREKWKDFMISFRFMRSMSFISKMQLSITNENKDVEKNKESYIVENLLKHFQ